MPLVYFQELIMNKVFNFSAGPAMLPAPVMEQAQAELLNWQDNGCSVMEMSHRSKAFIDVAEQAEQDLRDLMSVPNNYKVLFTHGGGRAQFSAIPLNLASSSDTADHLVSGSWSKGAVNEAQRYLQANVVATATEQNGSLTVPEPSQWQCSDNAAYLHYCPNETVDGVEINWVPDVGDVPLVADMSSNILSKHIDISKFGVVYAGAQKNIGPSGLSVVIIRDDLIGKARAETPSIFNYQLIAENGSMYNTPPTFAWYLAGLVFKWLKNQGGVAEMEVRNGQKAKLLYDAIDGNDFYINNIDTNYRSRMNVPFQLVDPQLDKDFLLEAQDAGLAALKGHRSVGGMRASIYNAMPIEGVQTLVDFMNAFAKRKG